MVKHNLTIKKFQTYGNIFENIKNNETIKTALASYGYDDTELSKGNALYNNAVEKVDNNKTKSTKEKLSYDQFIQKFNIFKKMYSEDRKVVKIIYKNDERILSALSLKGKASIRIGEILNNADTLYKQLKANKELIQPLGRVKIDESSVDEKISTLEEVKSLYKSYGLSKGESQQATIDKNKAFADLEEWVREFYAIAKIALKENPQLLESLGKVVKN